MPPFSPGDRVVVVGAGASRGATTSHGRACLPPLNADFFTQLQRISASKHADTVAAVVKDIVNLFGSNFDLTMEEYFTQLESIARMTRLAARTNAAFAPSEINKKRDNLMRALAAVLEESTDVSRSRANPCEHHAKIVDRLDAQDTIISFNYDCVMDHALRRIGAEKWSAKYGYCLPGPSRVAGHENWSAPNPPTRAADSVYLLKLHGSINWQLPDAGDGEVRLKERLYRQRGTPRFTIIPPEWAKDIDSDPTFSTLWKYAERALRNAKTITLIGFSFTPTDLHVESLFRVALAKTSRLKKLVIVNPTKSHRARIRKVFSKPLETGCVVQQYEKLSDYASQIDHAW